MTLKQFKFSDNLIEITTGIIKSSSNNPGESLIIAPSKRFFQYLTDNLFGINNGKSSFLPDFTTSDELITGILSILSLPIASSTEQIKMLMSSIKKSKGYEKIIPAGSFESYNGAMIGAKKIHKLFGEILKNKIPSSLPNFFDEIKTHYPEPYQGFNDHIDILSSISENYEKIQIEENNYDPAFLIPKIGSHEISEYFKMYNQIVLISPTALTTFEKMIYSTIESKLIVITQDTCDYDFSSVRDWPQTLQGKNNVKTRYFTGSNSKETAKNIFYSEEPSLMYEASKILNIIQNELKNGTELNEILILNLDNTLSEILFDSLNSYGIPSNLSQGLSIKREPLYQFFSAIADFFSEHKSGSLIKLLANPIFSDFSGLALFPDTIRALKSKIIDEKIYQVYSINDDVFYNFKSIKEPLKKLEDIYKSKDTSDLYNKLNDLFSIIGPKKSFEFYSFRELVEEAVLELSVLEPEIKDSPFNIFLSILGYKRLPQIGKVGEGVQILGLLETRGLTFKTVIIPSFNEGIFPTPSQDYRLLNSSLRRSIGLPSLYQQEELEFYYLKRLIDSSEKCYILSLSSNDGSVDIPSRYIYLFDREPLKKPVNNYTIPVKQKFNSNIRYIGIDNPRLTSRINSFSRLDIDRIKKCPTMYYIAKILGVKEEKTLAEEIDASLIGTVIHQVFYELYLNTKVPPNNTDLADNKKFEDNLKSNLDNLLKIHLKNNLFFTEEFILIKEIIREMCFNIVENDISRIRKGYRICSELSETELSAIIGETRYTIHGRIDRVDRTPSGSYMIIDYKTGTLPSKSSHMEKNNFKEVQLAVYGLLFKKNYPKHQISSLNYYDFKNKSLTKIVDEDAIDSYLNSFENHLIELFEAFNSAEHLNLAEDIDNCRYCPFENICRISEL